VLKDDLDQRQAAITANTDHADRNEAVKPHQQAIA